MAADLRPVTVGAALADAGVASRRAADDPPEVTRLDGGYSWITLRVSWGAGDAVIVRVAPVGGTVEPYDPTAEARRLRATSGVVPAPEVLAVCEVPNRRLTTICLYVTIRVPSTSRGRKASWRTTNTTNAIRRMNIVAE